MKVIDIYNKVAKGEEVPHFIIDETEYYIGADGFVKDVFGEEVEWTIDKQWLNEEVEIIEKPKDKWNKLKIWLKEDAFKNLESKGIVLTTDEVLNQMAGLDYEEELDLFEMIEDMKNKPKHIEEVKELKKQLEENKNKINWYENFEINKTTDKLRLKYNTQQKEFIKYLEDNYKETQDIWYIKILQKYKEIMGNIYKNEVE